VTEPQLTLARWRRALAIPMLRPVLPPAWLAWAVGWFWRLTFGAIGWPWLLRSLSGGTPERRDALLARLGLPTDALPALGSWRADAGFLHHLVDVIEERRPATIVELGAGVSTLVGARALQLNGGGSWLSFDHNERFASETGERLRKLGLHATVRHAPLRAPAPADPGLWYQLADLPDCIDLLIVDGPPWTVHPLVRGQAERLFDRLAPHAVVLLDDADRPGERLVARRWQRRWPLIRFERLGGTTKGILVGRVGPAGPASRA
jgi:predicted O-methyltransferase YrrM